MITIQELLYNRGLEKNVKVKLVRHKDSRQDLYDLYKNHRSEFLAYQRVHNLKMSLKMSNILFRLLVKKVFSPDLLEFIRLQTDKSSLMIASIMK